MGPKFTRRRFFQLALVAGAGYAGYRYSQQKVIRTAIIGAGGRARNIAGNSRYTQYFDTYGKVVAVCDVNRTRADEMRAKYAPSAVTMQDYRKVLERDDIDAVFVVTPDHWHVPISLEALAAGKHVYCEKPMTLTIAEGWQLREAVKRSNRVFLVGTQQRSDSYFQGACDLVRNGRLGQLKQVTISVPEGVAGGPFPVQPVPGDLDWDQWLGPAPTADYYPERCVHFRGFYEYSGGVMTDWGAHHLDIAQWAMGSEDSGPVMVSSEADLPRIENGCNTPAQFTVDLKYANGVNVRVSTNGKENCMLFEGDGGRIRVARGKLTGKPVEDLASNPLPPDAIRLKHSGMYLGNAAFIHLRHFLNCIALGETPISDVHSQHRSVTACHLANISLRLQRPVRWDPAQEAFVDDPEASSMVNRTARQRIPNIAEKEMIQKRT